MRGISVFLYSISQGLKSLRKNRMFTMASIGTIAACLFLFGLFYFMVSNFQNMIQSVESSVGVTVFFKEGISDAQIKTIGETITKRKEVSKCDYISAEDAWERFKQKMSKDSSDDIASTFGEDNPLKDSASYEIYLHHLSDQDELVKYIEQIDGVRQVNRSDTTAKSLSSISNLVGYVSATIIIILLLVSIFLIRTTISNGITVRKAEIGIMRLMGASDFFIRAPFVIEGIMIGIIGAAIPLLILLFSYGRIIGYIASKFTSLNNILTFLSTKEIFTWLAPICIVLGVGIGFFGSLLTVRKHLRV